MLKISNIIMGIIGVILCEVGINSPIENGGIQFTIFGAALILYSAISDQKNN